MKKLNKFTVDLKKDHIELLNLINSFRKAVEASHQDRAKEILERMDNLASGHFNFEEIYLYPRLRRMIMQVTKSLCNEQKILGEFIFRSRCLLKKNNLSRNGLRGILEMLPRLSKLFAECDSLTSLIKKFGKEDKEDLNQRFYEFRKTKNWSISKSFRERRFE